MIEDKRSFPIKLSWQYYRKYTDFELKDDIVPYTFISGDFADGYHFARHELKHSTPETLDAVLHPEQWGWTVDQIMGYAHGINTYMGRWYRQQYQLFLAEKQWSELEHQARLVGESRPLLRKRLYECRSVLADWIQPYFISPIFDFENKRLLSNNSGYYIQWSVRQDPDEPESYENQQTSIGDCTVKKMRGHFKNYTILSEEDQ